MHASGESASAWTLTQSPPVELPEDTHAVVLAVDDESSLLELECRLIAAGIPHRAIREPDEPYNKALMAIGIYPMDRTTLRPLLKKLPLLR